MLYKWHRLAFVSVFTDFLKFYFSIHTWVHTYMYIYCNAKIVVDGAFQKIYVNVIYKIYSYINY